MIRCIEESGLTINHLFEARPSRELHWEQSRSRLKHTHTIPLCRPLRWPISSSKQCRAIRSCTSAYTRAAVHVRLGLTIRSTALSSSSAKLTTCSTTYSTSVETLDARLLRGGHPKLEKRHTIYPHLKPDLERNQVQPHQ